MRDSLQHWTLSLIVSANAHSMVVMRTDQMEYLRQIPCFTDDFVINCCLRKKTAFQGE